MRRTTGVRTVAARRRISGGIRRRAVRATLTAVAVLAVATGCAPRAGDAPPARAGSGAAAPVVPSAPAAAPPFSKAPAPSRQPSVAPTPKKPERSEPSAARAEPAPVLMSRGDQGPRVRELQARLAGIGWFGEAPTGTYGPVTAAAVEGFQRRRGLPATGAADTVTWRRLLGMTSEPTPDELRGRAAQKPAAALDPRCGTGRAICVSKTTRTLSWVVDGRVRSTMDVRFGSQYTPTREGVFRVFLKSRDHVSTLYDTPMPYALFFSGGQAVHYSADFAAQGYRGASHGCVNVRDRAAAAALFDEVRTGDKVVVHG
ncbi:L,D-transpeptidase family protein [Streptomyces sp. NPDC014894]|uniref:L,D-transpeptidase family protein n=1 Tax=Streptomyces sp. NPDC014894 TaxID=3364931 RepID=UPI0036FEF909